MTDNKVDAPKPKGTLALIEEMLTTLQELDARCDRLLADLAEAKRALDEDNAKYGIPPSRP